VSTDARANAAEASRSPDPMRPGDELYALQFRDGIEAGEFAAALQRCLSDAAGDSGESDDKPMAWILEPFVHFASGETCCVYLNERALAMARGTDLQVPHAERIARDDLPERTLLILG
jgi:hypothetical protein